MALEHQQGASKYLGNPSLDAGRALLQILLVALVIGLALASIFWPLMEFERLSGNDREYRIWLIEWVVADVLLTLILCRQEIVSLFRRRGVGRNQPVKGAGKQGGSAAG